MAYLCDLDLNKAVAYIIFGGIVFNLLRSDSSCVSVTLKVL